MSTAVISAVTVGVMLLYAVPGYLLVKSGMVSESSIPAFAKLLMYVCQPCLTVYCFGKAAFTKELIEECVIFFTVTFLLQCAALAVLFFLIHRKKDDVRLRVCSIAAVFGNCTFMGVPILEALMPDYPQAVILSTIFFLGMNILGWTAASYIITGDRKYISIKKVVLNPAVIGVAVAAAISAAGIKFPAQLEEGIALVGKMSTPLCMIIIGMRLAVIPLKPMFTDKYQYAAAAFKLMIYPLAALCIGKLLSFDVNMLKTLYVLACCPTAAVVLTFAELLGEGQQTAANTVTAGTILSVLTIPLMMLAVS